MIDRMTTKTTATKGHWPKGKRRNSSIYAPQTVRLIRSSYRQGLSLKQIARHLGVSDRTVRRWRDGIDCPSDERYRPIKSLVARWRRESF
jgi:DNA-binding transcriptional regulator YiaG